MTVTKLLRRVLAVTASVAALLAGTALAGPASAAPMSANAASTERAACAAGHLCVWEGSVLHEFSECGLFDFHGQGTGTVENNMAAGTTAKFYDGTGTTRWMIPAGSTGTVDLDIVFFVRPCF
ncbi:hypothetical protein H181DRAFT_00119 [Streptomyces sp. WMMB 714]|jgi:hypothetical protein|nr:hypothetical protein H181DRAFT_00119 [Streptomyces sp. WMMB 714]